VNQGKGLIGEIVRCPEVFRTNPAVSKIGNLSQVVHGRGTEVMVVDLTLEDREEKKHTYYNVKWIVGGREHRKRNPKINASYYRQIHSWGEVAHRPMLKVSQD
jgi:hypothetical protein